MASAWILVETGYGSASVATLLAIVSVVELIASPLVGISVDRFDRRRLNVASDLSRFLLLLATACAIAGFDAFLAICVSAALFAICDRVALTTSQSMIPALTPGRNLAVSNSAVFFAMQFGCLGAALLIGPLLSELSPALVFSVLATFFLVSAGCLSSMRLGPAGPGLGKLKSPSARIDWGLLNLFVVYALLYGSAVLVSMMGSSFVFAEQKGTAADFGYVEAAWSAGSLGGTLLLVMLTRVTTAHTLHLMLLGSNALALMALMLTRAPWTLIIFVTLGFLYNLGRVSVEATLQVRVSDKVLGRMKGVMHCLAVALGLLVFGVAAVLGESVFPSTIFFGFGAALLIAVFALCIGASPRRGEP